MSWKNIDLCVCNRSRLLQYSMSTWLRPEHRNLVHGVGKCARVLPNRYNCGFFCNKPAYGPQEAGQTRFIEINTKGRKKRVEFGGLACYEHGGPAKPQAIDNK